MTRIIIRFWGGYEADYVVVMGRGLGSCDADYDAAMCAKVYILIAKVCQSAAKCCQSRANVGNLTAPRGTDPVDKKSKKHKTVCSEQKTKK